MNRSEFGARRKQGCQSALAAAGQQTKMELVYQYLTGPRFRHRIDAIVERFTDMRDDLNRERKMRRTT
ncbi:MAG: hypothetical protein NTAFB05_19950 [Nitrobacter sp.]